MLLTKDVISFKYANMSRKKARAEMFCHVQSQRAPHININCSQSASVPLRTFPLFCLISYKNVCEPAFRCSYSVRFEGRAAFHWITDHNLEAKVDVRVTGLNFERIAQYHRTERTLRNNKLTSESLFVRRRPWFNHASLTPLS